MLGPSSKAATKQLARQAARQARAPKFYAGLGGYRAAAAPIGAVRSFASAAEDNRRPDPRSSTPADSPPTSSSADSHWAEADRASAAATTTAGDGSTTSATPAAPDTSTSSPDEALAYPAAGAAFNRQAFKSRQEPSRPSADSKRKRKRNAVSAVEAQPGAPLALPSTDPSTLQRPTRLVVPRPLGVRPLDGATKPPSPKPQKEFARLEPAERKWLEKRLRLAMPHLNPTELQQALLAHVAAISALPAKGARAKALYALLGQLHRERDERVNRPASQETAFVKQYQRKALSRPPTASPVPESAPPALVRPASPAERAIAPNPPAMPPPPAAPAAPLEPSSLLAKAAPATELASPEVPIPRLEEPPSAGPSATPEQRRVLQQALVGRAPESTPAAHLEAFHQPVRKPSRPPMPEAREAASEALKQRLSATKPRLPPIPPGVRLVPREHAAAPVEKTEVEVKEEADLSTLGFVALRPRSSRQAPAPPAAPSSVGAVVPTAGPDVPGLPALDASVDVEPRTPPFSLGPTPDALGSSTTREVNSSVSSSKTSLGVPPPRLAGSAADATLPTALALRGYLISNTQRKKLETQMKLARPDLNEADVRLAASVEIDRLNQLPDICCRLVAFEVLLVQVRSPNPDAAPRLTIKQCEELRAAVMSAYPSLSLDERTKIFRQAWQKLSRLPTQEAKDAKYTALLKRYRSAAAALFQSGLADYDLVAARTVDHRPIPGAKRPLKKAAAERPKAQRASQEAAAAESPVAPPPPTTTSAFRPGLHLVDGVLVDTMENPSDLRLGSLQRVLDARRAVQMALWIAATGLEPPLARMLYDASQIALATFQQARMTIHNAHYPKRVAKATPSPLEQLKEATDGFLSLVVEAEQPPLSVLASEHRSEELIDVLLPPAEGTSVGTYERSVGPQHISARNRFLDGEDNELDAYDVERFSLIPHSLDNHGYASLSLERRAKMLAPLLRPPYRFTPTPEIHDKLYGFDGLRTSQLQLVEDLIETDVESDLFWTNSNARGLSFEDLIFGKHHVARDRSEMDAFRPAGREAFSSWKERLSPESDLLDFETEAWASETNTVAPPASKTTPRSWKDRLASHPDSAASAFDLVDDEDGKDATRSPDQEEGLLSARSLAAPLPPPPTLATAPPAPLAVSSPTRSLPPHMAAPPASNVAPPQVKPEPAREPPRSFAPGSSSGPSSVPQVESAGPPRAAVTPVVPTKLLEGVTTAAGLVATSVPSAADLSTPASDDAASAVPTPRPASSGDPGTKHYLWRWESPKVRQTLGRKAFPSPRRRSSSSASSTAAGSAAFPGGEGPLGHYVHRSTLKMREMVVERHRAHACLLAWSRNIGAQRVAEAKSGSGGGVGSSNSPAAVAWRRLGVPQRNLNEVDVGNELY